MELEEFTLALDPALSTARGTIQERRGLLVEVEYRGCEGIGEATPLVGWTESYDECRSALDHAATVAKAHDWGVALAQLDAPAARHGLALAYADARARSQQQPLYQTLSDAPGEAGTVACVPVNATLGAAADPGSLASRARECVEEGYGCLKLKVGSGALEDDVDRVRAVREQVGPDVELRVDANGAWTPEQAHEAIDQLAQLDVSYVEQPLPTAHLQETVALRGGGVDIALDESLAAHDVETILDVGAADVLVLKPMVLGGPDAAAIAADRARKAGVEPVVSTTVDAVVARTAAVHVAASIPDVRACGLATGGRIREDLAPDPAPVVDGAIEVPQERGLGLREFP